MRVVGSLTTIPSRIGTIERTLHSLGNQSHKLDAIYLSIPYTCQRENSEYYIPDYLTEYCHIIRCQDYGPITKIMGALLSEQDPDTVIITFDDDCVYPESIVEKLLSKHRINPECAIGSAGFKIGTFPFYMSITFNQNEHNKRWYTFDVGAEGELVDVLFGSPGVLYVREFFPPKDRLDKLLRYPNEDPILYRNDDVVISAVLAQRGIERRIYKMPRVDDYGDDNSALSKNKNEYAFSLIKALHATRKKEMFKKYVTYTRSKTLTYPIILTLVSIIVFSILFSTRNKLS